MSVVELKIDEPKHNADFVDSGAAQLRGRLLTTGLGTLFFKWYTSLSATPTPLATTLEAAVALPLGSQALVLSAKDVAGDTLADIQAVKHAGMTGGAPDTPAPCVVHVLRAVMAEPKTDGATLSKASATLSAQVPAMWEDRNYQRTLNQIRYSWHFTPTGEPTGRAAADFVPPLAFAPPVGAQADQPPSKLVAPFSFNPEFEIAPGVKVPVMRYQGALPAALGTGSYVLKLRVQKLVGAPTLHEVSRNVVLTA